MRLGILLPILCASSPAQTFESNHARGEALVQQGEIAAAVPYLREAWKIDPSNYDNAFDLALACLETKAFDEARKVVGAFLERADRSELHNLLGDIEESSGNFVEAVRQYERAARADPSEKNVFDLGSALLNHQGFEQAILVLEFGAGKYPDSARMKVAQGIAYYSRGRYSEAAEALCKAADLDPKDTRSMEFLGKMRDVSPEMAAQVAKRLARFVKLFPDNPRANYYAALSLGDKNEAERLLLRAIRLDPLMADAHYQLGVLYQTQDHAAKAVAEYEAAIRIQPGLSSAHYRLARLYGALGKTEQARREREIFLSLPRDP